MFIISGDGSKWLIATKDAVIGDFYSNKDRQILKSSLNSDIHTAKWYHRQSDPQDPWVSLLDHDGGSDSMLYGEASSTDNVKSVSDNNGANVYIRHKGKIFIKFHEFSSLILIRFLKVCLHRFLRNLENLKI